MRWLTGNVEELSKEIRQEQEQLNENNEVIDRQVRDIIERVRNEQDIALFTYTKLFDGVEIRSLEVSEEVIDKAFEQIEPEVLEALKKATENIVSYHEKQKELGFVDFPKEGIIRGQKIEPIEKVAVYVPGGTAAYPSSVLMNVLPAKIAGVSQIIMLTPPPKDGNFIPAILVAARLSGVDKIYQVGGAQGIAAAAYGTQTIPKVDKIVGPGNAYVATAKKQVFGQVGIDMIAGPSEIGVIADETANPAFVAADLLSQAEHDTLSRSILVTNSETFGQEVEKEINKQLTKLTREKIARESIENQGLVIVAEKFDEMFELMNEVAPEHLEIALDNSLDYLGKIKNAGSVFLGHYTTESIGDYFAGSNHVLPTSGTARFSSALGVHDFVKRIQYIHYTQEALEKDKGYIKTLAYQERLDGHAKSVEVREEDN